MPNAPRHLPGGGIRIGSDVVAYLSHTLGSSNGDDTIRRHDNIANAGRWLHAIVDATSWIVVVPWWPFVALDIHRERGFADQLRYIKRCDALILCGDTISSHMNYEIEQAERHDVAIVNLTDFGYRPPSIESHLFADALDARLALALAKVGRVL